MKASDFSFRSRFVPVRTAKRRRAGSTRWLSRHLNDPYVAEAKRLGLRSRAAFKLMQIDDRRRLLRRGDAVIDLGASPGGWSAVAAERVGATRSDGGVVIAVDRSPMPPIAGVATVLADVMSDDVAARIDETVSALSFSLFSGFSGVLSDMAENACGDSRTDALRVSALCESATDLAFSVLRPGGWLLMKSLRGGDEASLLSRLKRSFGEVRSEKPPASRSDSRECYLLARGFER